MKVFLCILLGSCLVSISTATAAVEKIDVTVLDHSKGKVTVKINPGPPKSIDVDGEFYF